MENMVYLVIYDWQDPDYNGERREEIFSNYEDAKKQFDKWVLSDKEEEGGLGYNALHGESEFIIDIDEEDEYFAFEDGYAASNYTEVRLEKREVK